MFGQSQFLLKQIPVCLIGTYSQFIKHKLLYVCPFKPHTGLYSLMHEQLAKVTGTTLVITWVVREPQEPLYALTTFLQFN